MFKGFTVQTKVVKTPKNEKISETPEEFISEASAKIVNDLAKEFLKKTAITVGLIIVAFKAIDTAEQVILKKTKSADPQ